LAVILPQKPKNKTFKYKIVFSMEILVTHYYHNKLIIKLFLDNNHKINYFKSNTKYVLIIAVSTIITVLPQLIYWQLVTGSFLYQGYDNPAEGLDFLNPHTVNFLFSFRKGWFLYTPIMLFAIGGFYFLIKSKTSYGYAIVLFSIINIFILSTWTCWWYAASYSQRTMVDTYPVLAISLGFLVDKVKTYNKSIKYLFILIGIILLFINIFKMWQFDKGIISFDRETKPHFINNYFSTVKQNDDSLLLISRSLGNLIKIKNKNNYESKIVYSTTFNQQDNYFKEGIISEGNNNIFLIKSESDFTTAIHFPFSDFTKEKTHAYIKVTFDCLFTKDYLQNKFGFVELFEHDTKSYNYTCRDLNAIASFDTSTNKWNHYEFFLLTPEVRSQNDDFVCYFWNYGHNEIKLDNFKIESFEPVFDPR
jgi:hypothetical protein